MNTRRSFALIRRLLVGIVGCLLMACHAKNRETHKTKSVIPVAPCNDATLASDPNNCGGCGTLCGTYGQNPQGGVSFMQGSCGAGGVCTPFTAGLSTLDCFDLANGSLVGVSGGSNVCVSVLSSSQNCGGLGWQCLGGGCLNGQCGGQLLKPPALKLLGPTSVPETSNQFYHFAGGIGPYTCSYAPLGNADSGLVVLVNADGGGKQCEFETGSTPGTSTLLVTDSVGNQATLSVVVHA